MSTMPGVLEVEGYRNSTSIPLRVSCGTRTAYHLSAWFSGSAGIRGAGVPRSLESRSPSLTFSAVR
jgi:hypothetical protein